jgi:hypothetical protein
MRIETLLALVVWRESNISAKAKNWDEEKWFCVVGVSNRKENSHEFSVFL